MNRIGWTWCVFGVLYAGFFSWVTSFGGPLTPPEIEQYPTVMQQRDPPAAPATIALLRRFMEEDSGDDVLGKYMQYMYPALFSRASHPVLFGDAANTAMDLMNASGMERWTPGFSWVIHGCSWHSSSG